MDTENALVNIPVTKPASAKLPMNAGPKIAGGSPCGLDMLLGSALAWRQPLS
jgi:hypothetical protein